MNGVQLVRSHIAHSALDRAVHTPLGPTTPLGVILDYLVAGHASMITGEILALKGTLGMKGYPF